MKAAFLREPGDASKIEFGDFPAPEPSENEALVRVRACALNHLDIWVRNGSPAYRTNFPHILGSDISGEIAAIPANHPITQSPDHLKIGSPVFIAPGISCWNCSECLSGYDNQCGNYKIIGAGTKGGYAEYVSVPARNIFPKPPHLSFEECAAFPLTFLTAWHMLISRAQLKAGERVLVLGAGSGVGSAAIQIAKVAGGIVIAVSSSEEKLARAKAIGADYLIDGRKKDFSQAVREVTDGDGVDIVFEHVGPATWEESVRSLARRGRIVTCGATTGPTVSLDLRVIYMKDFSVLGSRMGTRAELEKIFALVNQGRLKPVISKLFALSEARAAHEFLEKKEQFGKVVLKVI